MYPSRKIVVRAATNNPSGILNESKKLPPSLVSFLAAAQLCFGYNLGFINIVNKKYKTLFKFITALGIFFIVLLFLLNVFFGADGYWPLWYLTQYLSFILVLTSAKYTLYEFLYDLSAIDELEAEFRYELGIFAWLYFTFGFVIKITTIVIYVSQVKGDLFYIILNIFMHIPPISTNVMSVVNVILFYHMYTCVKKLKIQLKNDCDSKVVQIQTVYKTIADRFQKLRTRQDLLFILQFLTQSVNWTLRLWGHLFMIKTTNSWMLQFSSYVWALCITVQVCAPAVCAEMVTAQIDQIVSILHEQLLTETDVAKIVTLTRLLRYVEARPLMSKTWRLLPLDLRLPVTMLSMCITYLIVLVQFTHLYD